MNAQTKICQNCKNSFTIQPEDFAFYEKMQVPPPTFCPECRLIRRCMFRNEHFLFRRKNEADGKEIFAGMPSEAPYKIYDHEYWWSDKWDPMVYGREYDFSKPFFEQFRELLRDVPWNAKTVMSVENSDYCDQASYLKNVYLGFDLDHCENSAYVVNVGYGKESYDLLASFHVELCYEDTMVNKSYRTFFSYNCEDCNDVWLSRDCSGCTDCFGCVNLKSKSHHIFNAPYTKEKYAKKMQELNLGSFASFEAHSAEAYEFWKRFPVRYLRGWRNVGSSGEYLNDTKNVTSSFLVADTENSKFLQSVVYKCADSYDYTVWGEDATQIYECLTCGMQVDSLKFCYDCWPSCRNLEYSALCRNSSNLFGCVGLRNKEYCIFNRQYSKEEYSELRKKIIEHMTTMPYVDLFKNKYMYGEFFPSEFSHLSYNNSFAQDLFPLTKEEARAKNVPWHEADPREYKTTLSSGAIPDDVKNVPDSITKEIIQCANCNRAYRIIEPELLFLKRMGIPIPRVCFDCRLARKFSVINKPRFYQRHCQCKGALAKPLEYTNLDRHFHGESPCPNEFETSYAPDRSEIVYCEQCYQAETA